MSMTKRYRTSFLTRRSMASLILSGLITSMSQVMLCLPQMSIISCVSLIPPIILPFTTRFPVKIYIWGGLAYFGAIWILYRSIYLSMQNFKCYQISKEKKAIQLASLVHQQTPTSHSLWAIPRWDRGSG